jgi:hypothetical protein
LVGSCLGAMGSLWSSLFKKFLLSRIGSRRISPSCQSCCGSHKQQSRQPMFKTSGFGFFPYASCGGALPAWPHGIVGLSDLHGPKRNTVRPAQHTPAPGRSGTHHRLPGSQQRISKMHGRAANARRGGLRRISRSSAFF